MTGLGFGIGLGLVFSMLIWIGFEEFRKKGLPSKEAPNILSAIAAGFSALTTLGLVFIGFQQWRVQEHTDAVQSAMSRAYLFPTAFEAKGPPALGQNFLVALSWKNGGPVPAFHVRSHFDDFEVVPVRNILGGLSILDSHAPDLMRRVTQTSGGLLSGPDSCAEASKSLIESVEYPSSQGSHSSSGVTGSFIDQAVLDGTSAIFFRGCFVYETAGTPHYSRFCYFYNATLMKGRPNENGWVHCLSGVDAD
jgi:hypothetical protein